MRSANANTRYLVGLDHLRALAALLIVFYHGLHLLSFGPRAAGADPLRFWWISDNPLIALLEEGHTSVALFMVLSGFVFSSAALGKHIAYFAYLQNRFLRIYPLFVLLCLVAVTVSPGQYSLLALTQTLLFQGDLPGALNIVPYTSMFWAVAVEFQFYLLFPWLHRILEREGARWALACIVLMLVLRFIAASSGVANARDIAYWHLVGRLDQFLIGMLSARVFHRLSQRKLPWGLFSLLGLAAVLALLFAFNHAGGWPTSPLWKIAWPTAEALAWAGLLVPYVLFAEHMPGVISRPLAALGSISYSIYLLHYPCILLLPQYVRPWLQLEPNLASQAYVALVVLPVLVPLAALTYYAVERPFLRMRVRYLQEPEAT
ncbi:MAG: acyltransferase [Polyangiales bacterium]